jgi:hypothetical protein
LSRKSGQDQQSYNVTWSTTPDISTTIQIDLYKGGTAPGNYVGHINTSASNTGSYSWTPSGYSGSDYYVGMSAQSGKVFDFSNGPFSITNTPQVQVTVGTSPSGLSFTVDGNTYYSTQIFTWTQGSSHTIGTTSSQSGGTGIQYTWNYWSDYGSMSHTITPTSNTTYTAYFNTQYYLTMVAGSGGTVTPSSNWYNSGQSISISALPNVGYKFNNWTGSGSGSYSGTSNNTSVNMYGPITETASFSVATVRSLTVSSTNPNSGVNIIVSPSDKNGAGNGSTQFTRSYYENTNVNLTAPSTASGNVFQKWQRDGVDLTSNQSVTISMDINHTMTAVYATCTYSLSSYNSPQFPSVGGSSSFNVSTQSSCAWSPAKSDSWITITGGTGPGSGTVNYSVSENPSQNSRNGWIDVAGQRHNILQDGKPRSYGTTVITHGLIYKFIVEGTGLKDARWTLSMATSIADRLQNARVYIIRDGNPEVYYTIGDFEIGEKIIVFDWVRESDRNLLGYAEGAADVLTAALIQGAINGFWKLEQLHFIGHSRGTVVLSETIERLGYYSQYPGMLPMNMLIDNNIHFTTLDAHPWDNHEEDYICDFYSAEDYSVNGGSIKKGVVCWENIRYFDNYWHFTNDACVLNIGDPWNILSDLDGLRTISGCQYTIDLSSKDPMSHSHVHAWYFGTMPAIFPQNDGGDPPNDISPVWYESDIERRSLGFNTSLVAGGDISPLQTTSERTLISSDTKLNLHMIFNGHFSYRGKYVYDLAAPTGLWLDGIPGWEMQGGGGNGHVINSSDCFGLNPHLVLDQHNTERTHNRFYIPSNVSKIWFRVKVSNIDWLWNDYLKVYIGDVKVKGYRLQGWTEYIWEWIDVTPYQGTTATLTFKLMEGKFGVDSEVWIDDIGFEKSPYIIASTGAACGFPLKTNTKLSSASYNVELHAYDTYGNHTGPTSDTTWEANIPGSEYIIESDTLPNPQTAIILPPPQLGESYRFRMASSVPGSYGFKVEDVTGQYQTYSAIFDSVVLSPNSIATCSLSTVTSDLKLSIDSDGNGIADTAISPRAINYPPEAFNLMSPGNSEILSTTHPRFTWNRSTDFNEDSLHYKVYFSISSAFTSIDSSETLKDTNWTCPFSLNPNSHYYWKVKVWDPAGNVNWCTDSSWYFTNGVPTSEPLKLAGLDSFDGKVPLFWKAPSIALQNKASQKQKRGGLSARKFNEDMLSEIELIGNQSKAISGLIGYNIYRSNVSGGLILSRFSGQQVKTKNYLIQIAPVIDNR